jgi:hypothetical protein
VGGRARAIAFLRDVGVCAARGEQDRLEAKRHLMLRCLHAKRLMVKREEAGLLLFHTARTLFNFKVIRLPCVDEGEAR